MIWIALKMLTGDRAKYLGIVFGVAFASLLMTHQVSIFVGIMRRTTSQIFDIHEAGVWVMDKHVQYMEEIEPLRDTDLQRVRSVPGVQWAVRLYKGLIRAKLTETGKFRQVVMLGLDDATLVGAPLTMIQGTLSELRRPDAVIIDEAGYRHLWPGEPLTLGKTLQINDKRAVLVGICKASINFNSLPIVYTRFNQAVQYAPRERKLMTFVLAGVQPGQDSGEVCRRIEEQTRLQALTREQFIWKTIFYYLRHTGIPFNFGITVLLGFIVGVAIAGQTFYLFTLENLKQFGALKAMGVTNLHLIGMVFLQALVVGVLGYGIGIGLAAAFFEATKHNPALAGIYVPWQVMTGTGVAVLVIVLVASLISLRRVLVLEPAIVFR